MKKLLTLLTLSLLIITSSAVFEVKAEAVRFDSANPKDAAVFIETLNNRFTEENIKLKKENIVLMASKPELSSERTVEFAWAVNSSALGENIDISNLEKAKYLSKKILKETDIVKNTAEKTFSNLRNFKLILYSSPQNINKRIAILSSSEIERENVRKIIPEVVLMQEGIEIQDIKTEAEYSFEYRIFNY